MHLIHRLSTRKDKVLINLFKFKLYRAFPIGKIYTNVKCVRENSAYSEKILSHTLVIFTSFKRRNIYERYILFYPYFFVNT